MFSKPSTSYNTTSPKQFNFTKSVADKEVETEITEIKEAYGKYFITILQEN